MPRSRFSPVKTTNDLLAVRSDAFEMTDSFRVRLHTSLAVPPNIDLDERFYRRIDDCDRRFPDGPPSLRHCSSLRVRGDVLFERDVIAVGEVTVETSSVQARIPADSRLSGEVMLD